MNSWLTNLFYQQYSSAMYAYLALKMLEQLDSDEDSSSADEFHDYVVASKRRRTDSEHSEDGRQSKQELQDYGVTTSSAPSSFPRTTDTVTGKTDKNETKNGDSARLNYDQLEYMVEYLERNPDLAKGRARTRVGLQRTKDEWTELAAELNKIEGGVVKTGKGWAKYWSNKKCTLIKNREKLVTSHRACVEADIIVPSFDIRLLAVLGSLDGNDLVLDPKKVGPQEEGNNIKLLSLQPPPEPPVLADGPSSAPPLPVACDDDIPAKTPPCPDPTLEMKQPLQNEANIAEPKDITPKESERSALYSSFEKMEVLTLKIKTHFDSVIKAWNSDRKKMKKMLNEQQRNITKIRESLNNGRI